MARPTAENLNKIINGYTISYLGVKTPSNFSVLIKQRIYSGTLTPNYFKLAQQKNGLPVNSHQVQIFLADIKLMTRTKVNSLSQTQTEFLPQESLYSSGNGIARSISHSNLAYRKAVERNIAKTKDMSVNVAQALAEVTKTIDMVADSANRLANAILALKKGNFRKAAKALGTTARGRKFDPKKSLSDNWLALQYGWLPLLSDIDGACQQLAKQPRPPYFTVTTTATESDSQQIVRFTSGLGGSDWYELGYTSKTKVSQTFAVRNHSVKTMSELGIRDPLLLAWELVPYSFVVDWILPVGKYLAGINYTDGLVFIRGFTVQFTKNNWNCNARPVFNTSGGITTSYAGGSCHSSTNVLLNRSPLGSAVDNLLPSFKNPLSLTHMANGLALMSKAFR